MIELLLTDSNEYPSLFIVDDDKVFCDVLAKAMTKRGFSVTCAYTIDDALKLAEASAPEYAIVDLKLSSESGLVLVEKLKTLDPGTRIVMLTGYASIATAVEAIKPVSYTHLTLPTNREV
mgnify:CR=1 FL=1